MKVLFFGATPPDALKGLGRSIRLEPVADAGAAKAAITDGGPEAAVVDVRNDAKPVWELVERLNAAGVPVVALAQNEEQALAALERGALDAVTEAEMTRQALERALKMAVVRHRSAAARQRETVAAMTARVTELRERERQLRLLNQMGELLQSAVDASEAYGVITLAAQMAFDEAPEPRAISSGRLGLIQPNGKVQFLAAWGEQCLPDAEHEAATCQALKRGHAHLSADPANACGHLLSGQAAPAGALRPCLCLPLFAHGEALGVLQLTACGDDAETLELLRRASAFATTFAEHIALSLANLKLREKLREQAVQDPLTGLLNRRYLEEILSRELRRAARRDSTVGVIMMDVDHFKEYNDRFGHPAGDRLLRSLGRFLTLHTRGADVACRYGGDEFLLILPEAGPQAVCERAEQLRTGFHPEAQPPAPNPQLTLSLGAAVFPGDGRTPAALIQAADSALYAAKRRGRNQVAAASAFVAA